MPVTVTATGANAWDDIEIVDFAGDISKQQGNIVEVHTYFEDNGSKDATIQIGLDVDANPYNGVSGSPFFTFTPAGPPSGYVSAALDTTSITPNTYCVYAKISNGTHTRYYYARGRLLVTAAPDPGAPTITITTPTSGDTYTTGSSTIHLHGTASANTTQVTWRNQTTGDSGTATDTTSWETFGISLYPGPNVIVVTATDNLNRTGTDSITVTYDNTSRDVTFHSSGQAFIVSGSYSGHNYGAGTVFVGFDNDSRYQNERGLVSFDISGIPPGSTINGAHLQLYHLASTPSDAASIQIAAHRITGSWSESAVTWDSKPGYSTANDATLAIPSGTSGYRDWDVTGIVSNWNSGSYPDYGFMLISSVENSGTTNDREFDDGRMLLKINYSPERVPPTVTITSPTTQPVYSTTAASVGIGGTASDNYSVASVAWTNAANGEGGTALGTTSWSATVPLVGGTNQITVTATDAAGNTGYDVILVFRPPPDTTPPAVPTNLLASTVSSTAIYLTWDPSTDTGGSGLAGYQVYRDGELVGTTPSLSYLDNGLSPLTQYCYALAAYDNATNVSAQGSQVCATTQPIHYTLAITRDPADGGNVIITPPADAEGKYADGTVVTLTASQAVGYSFASWSGDVAGSVSPTNVTMTSDKSITANFVALPPAANFVANQTNGVVPLIVIFSDISTGIATNRLWNFGDGTTTNTSATSVVHTYTTPSANTVTLVVSGPGGVSTNTRVSYIIVDAPPTVAGFDAAPTRGTAPLSVQFTDRSSGIITNRLWDFGDGSISGAVNPSHTYVNAGTYTVSFTVLGLGGTDSVSRPGLIVVTPPPPGASFSASPTKGAVPLAVSFVDTSTGTITNRAWSFGDGGSSAVASVIHSYNSSGVYSVSLSVFGPGGSDTLNKPNLITATNSVPKITSPPTATNTVGQVGGATVVKPGQAIGFSVGSYDADGNPLNCLWNFGDGGSSADCNQSHVFTNCGPHDVSVTVGDGFASVETSMTVAVACPLDINSLKLQVKFKKVGSDACTIKGTLIDLPPNFLIANAAVTLDVGDAQVDFQLNAKGRAVDQNGNIKFSYNKKTATWTFTGKLKGSWRDKWAKYGLTDEIVTQRNVSPPVLLVIASDTPEAFDAEAPLSYRNKSGISGTATYRPTK